MSDLGIAALKWILLLFWIYVAVRLASAAWHKSKSENERKGRTHE